MAKNKRAFRALLKRIRTNTLKPKDTDTNGVLNLSRKGLTDKDAKTLVDALEGNTTLTQIDLSYNKIGKNCVQSLADALKGNTTLTQISLRLNGIGKKGAAALAEALEKNTTLTKIDLSFNEIGASGAAALAEALEKNTTLTKIELKGTSIGNKGAAALAEALEKNTTLTQIDLYGNNIRDAGVQALAEALKHNTTLTQISLRSNEIGKKGAAALADALKDNTTLTQISLRSNEIGKKGAAALADALKDNTTLTELDLSWNHIGASGAAALAGALEKNTPLTQINLSGNQIGKKGVAALAGALEKNTTLTKIFLRKNEIGHVGVKALADALKDNTTLTELDLSGNDIWNKGAKALADALEHNTTLTLLDISNNHISKAIRTRINGYLERNRKLAAQRPAVAPPEPFQQQRTVPVAPTLSVTNTPPPTTKALEVKIATLKAQIKTKEQNGQYDERHETLVAQLKTINTQLRELKQTKASKRQLQALEETIVTQEEFKKWATALENTDITQEIHELRTLLQHLQPGKDTALDLAQLQSQMQQVRAFMHAHAEQLGQLSNQAKAKTLANQELQTLLSTPQAKEYGYTLVATLNQFYLVGSILQTPYFEAPGTVGKNIGGVVSLVGKLLPVGGNYVELLANAVRNPSKKATTRSFARFVRIAQSPEGMHRMSQDILLGLARELGTEKLGTARCKVHIKYLTDFLLSDTLQTLDPPVESRQELVSMLVHVAQHGTLNGYKRQGKSPVTTPTPLDTDTRNNAFNKLDSPGYLYQGSDIGIIQDGGYLSGTPLSCLDAQQLNGVEHGATTTRLGGLLQQATAQNPAFFVYNKGRNHWVSVAITEVQGQKVVLYKDSLGGEIDPTLQTLLTVHGVQGHNIKVNRQAEQTGDGTHCGIMALENLARIKGWLGSASTNVDRFGEQDFFCTLRDAKMIRVTTYGEHYFKGVVAQMYKANQTPGTAAGIIDYLCDALTLAHNPSDAVQKRFVELAAEALASQALKTHLAKAGDNTVIDQAFIRRTLRAYLMRTPKPLPGAVVRRPKPKLQRPPKGRNFQSLLTKRLASIRKAVKPDEDEEDTPKAAPQPAQANHALQEMKKMLEQFKQALPPELLDILKTNTEAIQRRLEAAEKKSNEGKGNVAQELKQAFQGLERLSKNKLVKPTVVLGKNEQEFRKPKTATERNTETRVIAKLNNMQEMIFRGIVLDDEDKIDLKDDLQAALVDKALRSTAFRDAFLSDKREERRRVRKELKMEIGEGAMLLAKDPEADTEDIARTIATNLATAIAPAPQEDTTLNTTKRRTRRP